ncbi:carbamate kinase [Tateyamaria sp. ANG-S1]|uniref:carbamate kinase n=1 Tax=Tateyamaria sp. ANG-S1 TaxID=1577905 RepID=UPI00068C8ACF|nr:carbamate kinase [Tateyamaria sp. ANG-S1]
MRIVTALGSAALLPQGPDVSRDAHRANLVSAAKALAKLALEHQVVVTHGDGPQPGVLALQGQAGPSAEVMGTQTDSLIGYMLEQELGNWLPFDTPIATLVPMIEVDPDDPAFDTPMHCVGPVYDRAEAERIAVRTGWQMRADGGGWRRVVATPVPRRIFQKRPLEWLVEQGTIVLCAGGGGVPTAYNDAGDLVCVDALIDKDFAAALIAREVGADLFLAATGADAVCLDWGTADQRAVKTAAPDALERHAFAAGSIGPKVAAACQFVRATGKPAAIGALCDLSAMVAGARGTVISPDVTGITFHEPASEPGAALAPEMRHGT